MPDLWVTCALGPYNFEFMTAVTKEIVDALQSGRHLQQSLVGLRHVLLRALPEEFPRILRPRFAAHHRIRRTPRAAQYIVWHQQRLFELWRLWDGEDQSHQSDAALHRQLPAAERSAIST